MHWKKKVALGCGVFFGGVGVASAQAPRCTNLSHPPRWSRCGRAPIRPTKRGLFPTRLPTAIKRRTCRRIGAACRTASASPGSASAEPETRQELRDAETGQTPAAPALGPTPLVDVKILEKWIYGDNADQAKIHFAGWMDFDYTYRSTGTGQNNVAPVMNRFGDEFLARSLGLYVFKPLNEKELSWGFNVIYFGGADASFIQPTAGYPAQTNPRFGQSFTDLNLTAHLPIFTEGGVDIKAGRQTTVLGPQGALPWQRYFNSSDYAWYNLEEGRYTGISANWKISKQLSWYNGIEIGGWGVFYDDPSHNVNYITQINYWLDQEAKTTKVWTTVLTGPTGFHSDGNTTITEVGLLHNYNACVYQIIDSQLCYSKAPIFQAVPPGYQQRAYDVYTIFGIHLSKNLDWNNRVEWYKDVDGHFYPGGFGVPHTDYYETTVGLDYHPVKWLQFRPEVRYDHATNDNFGSTNDKKNQLTIDADVLIKF